MSTLGQMTTYIVGGFLLLVVCFFAALATAFAGTVHRAPVWYLPYLALTQALPILLFAISSFSLLHAFAKNIRFERMSRICFGSVVVYLLSFVVLFGLAQVGYFPK
jgi:hypothetical protein